MLQIVLAVYMHAYLLWSTYWYTCTSIRNTYTYLKLNLPYNANVLTVHSMAICAFVSFRTMPCILFGPRDLFAWATPH